MDPLLDLTQGDTNYISKHNSNYAALETAINSLESTRQLISQKGAANGYASLDANGKVPSAQLPTTSQQPYDIVMFCPGVPANGAIITRIVIPRAVTLPQNLTGSYANARLAATASTTLTIRSNGASIGTINFAGGATSGTFTFATQTTIAAGTILDIVNQATADATLGDISITLVGSR